MPREISIWCGHKKTMRITSFSAAPRMEALLSRLRKILPLPLRQRKTRKLRSIPVEASMWHGLTAVQVILRFSTAARRMGARHFQHRGRFQPILHLGTVSALTRLRWPPALIKTSPLRGKTTILQIVIKTSISLNSGISIWRVPPMAEQRFRHRSMFRTAQPSLELQPSGWMRILRTTLRG